MALLVSFTTWGQRFQVTLESGQNILCFVKSGTNEVSVEQVEGDSPSGDMVIPETVTDGTNTIPGEFLMLDKEERFKGDTVFYASKVKFVPTNQFAQNELVATLCFSPDTSA